MKKEIGYIGLGKMGRNMVGRLLEHKWRVVATDQDPQSVAKVSEQGAVGASDVPELVAKLSTPRTIWIMVPHGAVESVIDALTPLLSEGDLVIDGGNSPYQNSIRNFSNLKAKGIRFMDIGVSGGPGGAESGACMMAGGLKNDFDVLESSGFFAETCTPEGWSYVGAPGSGHYAKMIHNGIEYGMMQSIAEGFDLLKHSKEFAFDLKEVSRIYSTGSVISSRLVSWVHDAYSKYGSELEDISGKASASGEGKWTVETGEKENIPMPAIRAALSVRSSSVEKPSYQGKLISAMRGEFGGHPVKRGEEEPKTI